MKLLLKLVIEVSNDNWRQQASDEDSLIFGYINPEPTIETSYYKCHDGIGHQWTNGIEYAKEFNTQYEIDTLLLELKAYNFEGTFGTEESISDSIKEMNKI